MVEIIAFSYALWILTSLGYLFSYIAIYLSLLFHQHAQQCKHDFEACLRWSLNCRRRISQVALFNRRILLAIRIRNTLVDTVGTIKVLDQVNGKIISRAAFYSVLVNVPINIIWIVSLHYSEDSFNSTNSVIVLAIGYQLVAILNILVPMTLVAEEFSSFIQYLHPIQWHIQKQYIRLKLDIFNLYHLLNGKSRIAFTVGPIAHITPKSMADVRFLCVFFPIQSYFFCSRAWHSTVLSYS